VGFCHAGLATSDRDTGGLTLRRIQTFDVVVVGAGPGGAAAAFALAHSGRRVLLAGAPNRRPINLGESLPPTARPLLHAMGVVDELTKGTHLPCLGNLSIWGSPAVRCVDFIFDPNGQGWHLDRPSFDAALVHAARAAGAEMRHAFVRHVKGAPGRWRLWIDDQSSAGYEVGCRWLIDASGRRAVLARRLGGVLRAKDRLIAFTAQIEPSDRADTELHTMVEASADGWWYTSLVPGDRRVVIYLTDADLAPPGLARGTNVFAEMIERTACIGPYFEAFRYTIDTPPRVTSARTARLDPPAGDGWAASGDAALALDPLSSRGVLTALWSGIRCGEAVHTSLGGDADALNLYVRSLDTAFADFLRDRAAYYSLEGRWLDRPFWLRRKTIARMDAQPSTQGTNQAEARRRLEETQ
jgi:flavin-dependent dehydrogenase